MAHRRNSILVEGFISHHDPGSTPTRSRTPKTHRRTAVFKVVNFDISSCRTMLYSPIHSRILDRSLSSMAEKTALKAPGSVSRIHV